MTTEKQYNQEDQYFYKKKNYIGSSLFNFESFVNILIEKE